MLWLPFLSKGTLKFLVMLFFSSQFLPLRPHFLQPLPSDETEVIKSGTLLQWAGSTAVSPQLTSAAQMPAITSLCASVTVDLDSPSALPGSDSHKKSGKISVSHALININAGP